MNMEDQSKIRPVKVRKVKVIKPLEAVAPVAPVAAPKRPAVLKPIRAPVVTSKPIRAPVESPGKQLWLDLDPWKLDPSRAFHYGHSLIWFLDMGVKQVGIGPDLSIHVETYDGRSVVIPSIVMVTRDRRYALDFIRYSVNGKNTDELQWYIDQYDKEFAELLKQWAVKD